MTTLTKTSFLTRLFAVLFLFLPIILSGCKQVGDGGPGFLGFSGEKAEPKIVVRGNSVGADEIPWHIQAAIAATVSRIRGEDNNDIDAKFHVVGSGGIEEDITTNLENFGVTNILINDFFHPEETPTTYRLGARLIMVDATGRRLGISMVTDYDLSNNQLVLKGHNWDYIRSANPFVETYILPATAFSKLDKKSIEDYATFRLHVLENALSISPGNVPLDADDYSIVTFMMDRLLPKDTFEVKSSAVKSGPKGFTEDSRYIVHDNAWVTGIISGNFSLAEDQSFWVKAVYAPKDGQDAVIGLYNTANLAAPSS